jgi:biotin carboxyl carrier protein
MTQFRLAIHGQEREFEVTRQDDRLHVVVDDVAADVRVLYRDGQTMILEVSQPGGEPARVHLIGARQGDKRQLWIDGRILPVERARRRAGRPAADPGSLAASIPAVVSQILVGVGDRVAAGDKLILLESMKMVIPIQAPHDGCVARILCDVGESVPAGVPLVEIDSL